MANKHMPYDLAQMQSLPLEAKIIMTQQRIKGWYDYWNGDVYVSFSGGMDSTVLKHIVDNMFGMGDVPSVFVNTGLEYPEIQRFVKDIKDGKYDCFNSNVEIIRPQMRFDQVLKKYGFPVISKEVSHKLHDLTTARRNGNFDSYAERQFQGNYVSKKGKPNAFSVEKWKFLIDAPFNCSHMCCDVMKKKPAKQYEKKTGRKPIIGTMADESKLRYQRWLREGCNAFESKKPTSQPLSFWTKQDILHYIKKFNVPYCSVYGDIVVKPIGDVDERQLNVIDLLGCYEEDDVLTTTGCERTGCIFCMFGCHLEKTPNRFQKLKETHPRQYEYCINGGEMSDGKWKPNKEGLGLGKVLDFIGVKYE